jgi:hypothetical protein
MELMQQYGHRLWNIMLMYTATPPRMEFVLQIYSLDHQFVDTDWWMYMFGDAHLMFWNQKSTRTKVTEMGTTTKTRHLLGPQSATCQWGSIGTNQFHVVFMIFLPLCLQLRGRLNHHTIGHIYVLKTPHTSWFTNRTFGWWMAQWRGIGTQALLSKSGWKN